MREQDRKRVQAVFYQTRGGRQPVREWLLTLPAEDRRIIGEDIKTVELGWPIGMPVCRALGEGLYEIRSTIAAGRVEARVYVAIEDGLVVLLHWQRGKAGQDRAISQSRKLLSDYRQRRV
jgi:phage-related protein